MKSLYTLWVLVFCVFVLNAQPSGISDIEASYRARKQREENSLLKEFPTRNIGPTVQGGRIVDIEVNLKNTKEFYVGYGSGGVFKTVNNGITFEPVFDQIDALGIGDFALPQAPGFSLKLGANNVVYSLRFELINDSLICFNSGKNNRNSASNSAKYFSRS